MVGMKKDMLDISHLPKAIPNARAAAGQALLDGNMIGVMIDPEKNYNLEHHPFAEPGRLLQNFAQNSKDEICTHGRDIFKSYDAYEAYQWRQPGVSPALAHEDLDFYFTQPFIQKMRRSGGDLPAKIAALADQVNINPYSEFTRGIEKHCANSAAEYIHPRQLRHAVRSGHFLVYADATDTLKLGTLADEPPAAHGYYQKYARLMVATQPYFAYFALSDTQAHEAGHMTDYVEGSSIFSARYQLFNDELLKTSRHAISHIESLLAKSNKTTRDADIEKLRGHLSRDHVRQKFQEAHPSLGNNVNSHLQHVLVHAHQQLMSSLPPEERYKINMRGEKKPLSGREKHYGSRAEQIKEIPAAVSCISNRYGQKVARIVMGPAYEVVKAVDAYNPNLRDDPEALYMRIPELRKLGPSRDARKEEIQAEWQKRLASAQKNKDTRSKA